MSEPGRYVLNVDQIQKVSCRIGRRFSWWTGFSRSSPTALSRIFRRETCRELRSLGLKNLSFNEPYFQGHFPGFAIFPGVLMIEAMAQMASFSIYPYVEKDLAKFTRDFQCILGRRGQRPLPQAVGSRRLDPDSNDGHEMSRPSLGVQLRSFGRRTEGRRGRNHGQYDHELQRGRMPA